MGAAEDFSVGSQKLQGQRELKSSYLARAPQSAGPVSLPGPLAK